MAVRPVLVGVCARLKVWFRDKSIREEITQEKLEKRWNAMSRKPRDEPCFFLRGWWFFLSKLHLSCFLFPGTGWSKCTKCKEKKFYMNVHAHTHTSINAWTSMLGIGSDLSIQIHPPWRSLPAFVGVTRLPTKTHMLLWNYISKALFGSRRAVLCHGSICVYICTLTLHT